MAFTCDLHPVRVIYILGSEAHGICPELLAGLLTPAQRVYIPMQAGVESLNVGVAAALCLYRHALNLTSPGVE